MCLDKILYVLKQDVVERISQCAFQRPGIYGCAFQPSAYFLHPCVLIAEISIICMAQVPVIQHIAGSPALPENGREIIFMDGDAFLICFCQCAAGRKIC